MEIKNNKIVGIPFVEASAYGKNIIINPDAIIIHYTAGPSGASTVKLFSSPTAKTSAHFVVSEDGKITQMVDLNKMAYHAGVSSYNGRSSYNRFSIGIEISNPGFLEKIGDNYYTWWNVKTKKSPIPINQVYIGKHRNKQTTPIYWCKYTQEQINSVKDLCKTICSYYNIKEILGHEEIAPGRKSDPGPAFPLDNLRNEILNKNVIS